MMRGEATRAAIIEGAIAAIAIGGVAGATTRVIAREAAVRLATIHHHFPTKDALLAAVLEALAGQLGCALREAVRDAPGVAGLLRAAWRFAEQTLDLQRAQYELTLYALRTPDAAWLAERQYAAYLRIYADALGTDDTTSARLMLAGIDGLILQLMAGGDAVACRETLEGLIRALAPPDGRAED